MNPLRYFWIIIFSEIFWKKIIAYSLLGLAGWWLSDFLALFFITFICSYIFLEVGELIASKIHEWGVKWDQDRRHRIAKKYASTNTVVTLLYILFISIVVVIFVNILPKIGTDIRDLVRSAPDMARQVTEFTINLEKNTGLNLGLVEITNNLINPKNIEGVGQFLLTHITNGGIIMMKFLIGLILSYIFIIERKKVTDFFLRMKDGNFGFFYDEYALLARRVGEWFGLIFKAQSIIALVNALLTTIGLIIISFFLGHGGFPYILTLALIVFIFGFIPVFGTILSGVPIVIIAYGYGSLAAVAGVIIMIAVVHAVEAYYLNPKIVSSYVHFPVFITFLTLIISEHLFGLIGLLIGVPLLSILIVFIEDLDSYIDDLKTQIKFEEYERLHQK